MVQDSTCTSDSTIGTIEYLRKRKNARWSDEEKTVNCKMDWSNGSGKLFYVRDGIKNN